MKATWTRAASLLLFATALTVYLSSRVMVQSDSIWTIPTAASLLLRGDANLDEYTQALQRTSHGVHRQGEHAYNYFPLGPSLVALPVVAVMDLGLWPFEGSSAKALRGGLAWRLHFRATGDFDFGQFNTTERFIASLLTALAVLLVFLTARRETTLPIALALAAVFAFGTSAYSTASRVLWQHGPSLAALAAIIWLLARRGSPAFTGFAVALAYLFRPTHSVTVVLVTAFFLWKRRDALLPYFLGALAVAVPFCVYNALTYGHLLPPYFLAGRLDLPNAHVWEALAGNLVSPARGLLVYSPFLVLVAFRRRLTELEMVAVAGIGLHWLAISTFPHWWGGHSVGPRFFTDVLPYFAYLLIRPLESIWRSKAKLAAFSVAALLSVLVHWHAATSFAVHQWNDGPPNVDVAPQRVWDWKDPPFLRGL